MSKKIKKEPQASVYWSSIEEYNGIPDRYREEDHNKSVLDTFENNISGAKASRRDFLKLLGFSVTTAAFAASCERPVQKAIPYVIQPEEIVPGKSLYYASTYFDGKDYSSVLVKTREGRPIKIEGNPLSSFNFGGSTARIQASVLSLYDDARYKKPSLNKKDSTWDEIDSEIIAGMKKASAAGKRILLFTPTIISPSTRKLLQTLQSQFPDLTWVQYDAVSNSAIRDAYNELLNIPVIPDLRFDKADIVVSFNADFLGTWLAPGHFIPLYAKRRRLHNGEKNMLRHYQVEHGMTVTGSNADHRILISPSEEKGALVSIYNKLAGKLNKPGTRSLNSSVDTEEIANELLKAGSSSLVVSGSNDPECQMLVAGINSMLGAIGNTVDVENTLQIQAGNDKNTARAFDMIKKGECGAVLFCDVNPVYDHPEGEVIKEAIGNIELSAALSCNLNETAEACKIVCPTHHYLESWGDAEILNGELSLSQPVIRPLFNTRSFQDALLNWTGAEQEYDDYLKMFWRDNYWKGDGKFEDFWNKCLQDGILKYSPEVATGTDYSPVSIPDISEEKTAGGFTLILSESLQLGDGRHANNPWLQELPDPIAKVCWDNFVSVAPSDAREMGLKIGDLVLINGTAELPVIIQPGQAKSTLTASLGYGRVSAGKTGEGIGANMYPFVQMKDGSRIYYREGVKIEPTGRNITMALTQTHNSMEGRPIVREANYDEYFESPDAGNEMHEEAESHHKTLYPDVKFDGFHWGLAVDLNACVGCNTCVISCQAENNIPVVGKDEVFRRRIMHWIKIDRYYSDDPENPKVSYQPNMCQHCDNAPCENVCPVSATNHSSEGINQMSYNRCIGTKYCINNCPYRARRFNWYKYVDNEEFDYNANSDLGKMVLNPDVTVRSRGVVEKCSFCVQRIQEKKLEAKLENRTLKDGEIQPACVQACPAGALAFGNLKDKNSKVSLMFADSRNYHLLEQLHTLPSVGYLTKIRNEKKS